MTFIEAELLGDSKGEQVVIDSGALDHIAQEELTIPPRPRHTDGQDLARLQARDLRTRVNAGRRIRLPFSKTRYIVVRKVRDGHSPSARNRRLSSPGCAGCSRLVGLYSYAVMDCGKALFIRR